MIERATILARGGRLDIDAVLLPDPGRGGVATRTSSERVVQTSRPRGSRGRANLVAALERSGGKVYGGANDPEICQYPGISIVERDYDLAAE